MLAFKHLEKEETLDLIYYYIPIPYRAWKNEHIFG